MMNEQQLEDLCIIWFQGTGWQFARGSDIAPEGVNPDKDEISDLFGTTVDWQVRESVRARLRILVRRTLQKWKYPPPGPGEQDAVELVLKQAESLSNEWSK